MFTIHDSSVNTYNNPFFLQSEEQARRLFIRNVNQDPKEAIYTHAEQFTLFFVGEYDADQGTFKVPQTPQAIMKASDCKDPKAGEIKTFKDDLESFRQEINNLEKALKQDLSTIKGMLLND